MIGKTVAVDDVHDKPDVGNRAFLSSIQSCPRAQEIGFIWPRNSCVRTSCEWIKVAVQPSRSPTKKLMSAAKFIAALRLRLSTRARDELHVPQHAVPSEMAIARQLRRAKPSLRSRFNSARRVVGGRRFLRASPP